MLLVQAHKILYLLYMRATLGHWDKTAAHLVQIYAQWKFWALL